MQGSDFYHRDVASQVESELAYALPRYRVDLPFYRQVSVV